MVFDFRVSSKWSCLSLLTIFLLIFSLQSEAQSKSNKGTEFWVGFMFHFNGNTAGNALYITSDSSTTGTVSVPGESWSQNFTVTANNLTIVTIPSSIAYNGCSDCITSKGVKITSEKDVVVYAHQYLGNQSDATLVLPTETLGKEYFAASYFQNSSTGTRDQGRSTFLIVATQDNTQIKITPTIAIQRGTATASTGSLPANLPIDITLDEGEVYQGYGAGFALTDDVTGTSIEVIDTGATANCRKIAVFSGSSYTRIGGCPGSGFRPPANSGDNLFEQMYPINTWGKRFIIVPALGRDGDDFRFIAQEDNTEVVVFNSGGPPTIFNLNKGEFAQITDESNVRNVLSNNPIMVAQYQRTARCDGGTNRIGDPSMTILNPLEQTLTDITVFSSNFFDIDNHYINVVIPGYAANSFRIDGVTATFTPVPNNSFYSYARIPVSSGNHRLTANVGFIATAYGEGEYESYGYAAGANVKDLTAVATVSNSTQNGIVSNCIGRPTDFAGSAEYTVVAWEWDFGDGNTSSLQNPSHLYTDTGSYLARLYTFKPTFDGCSNYDSAFVEVNIFGKPIARLAKTNLCDSIEAVLTDVSEIPTPETYLTTLWSVQDVPGTRFGRNISQTFDTTGKYEVRMEVVTSNQCKDTLIDSLVVNPLPQADFSIADVCFVDTSYISDLSTVVTGTLRDWRWEFSDGNTSTDRNPQNFFADSGDHTVKLVVESDSGCLDSSEMTLYKHPRFELGFSVNDTCLGNGQTFMNTTLLEGGTFTDTLWYTSDLSRTATTFNYTDTFSAVDFYDISLVMEQDSFCRDTLTQRVNVFPLATPDFSFASTCLGDSTEFTNTSAVSSGSFTSDWSFEAGNTSALQDPKYLFSSGGIKNVNLSITTDQGCTTDTTKEVLITFPEILQINVQDICSGDSLIVTADTLRGLDVFDTYSWNYGSETTADPEIRTEFSTLGKTYVTLDVLTQNGCIISLTDSFVTQAKPEPNFLIGGVCEGLNIEPTENSVIDAPATISGYAWYNDGVLTSTDQNPSFASGISGNRTIKLVTTADNGCTDSVQKVGLVHPLPIADYTTTDMCIGATNTLTSSSSVSTGSIASLFWTVDGSEYTATTITPTFASDGDFDVRLIAQTDRGCRDTLENSVTVYPLPTLSFNLVALSGCVPFEAQVQSTSTISSGTIDNFIYKWGDGSTSTSDSSYTYNTPGNYSIEVVAESDQGCLDSIQIGTDVTVFNNPIADFAYSPNRPSTLTEFVILRDSSQGVITDWEWTTSDGGYYTGSQTQHTFNDSGSYAVTLLVQDDNGCEDEITKLIYVNADLFVYIPNTFSPNGDGLNDNFGLAGVIAGVNKMEMEIYNRWGERIFESNDVNKRWDGTYKGEPVAQGVYVYKVRFTNPKQSKWFFLDGEIHLLRK